MIYMWENDGLWGMTRERPTHVPVELHSQGVGSGVRGQRVRSLVVITRLLLFLQGVEGYVIKS